MEMILFPVLKAPPKVAKNFAIDCVHFDITREVGSIELFEHLAVATIGIHHANTLTMMLGVKNLAGSVRTQTLRVQQLLDDRARVASIRCNGLHWPVRVTTCLVILCVENLVVDASDAHGFVQLVGQRDDWGVAKEGSRFRLVVHAVGSVDGLAIGVRCAASWRPCDPTDTIVALLAKEQRSLAVSRG